MISEKNLGWLKKKKQMANNVSFSLSMAVIYYVVCNAKYTS